MIRRKVKGLKDTRRGTPLPKSPMNQNDVNQIQVTKLSIQCNDRLNVDIQNFAGPSVS